jgi:hypothetical protein
MAAEKHVFLKNGSDLFLRRALESGDHVGAVRKIRFLARVIFEVQSGVHGRCRAKN